jgi:FKBP-type peptidyl-prolyl cis-trans isomerase FkpA
MKNYVYIIVALISSFAFTSCNKDDDPGYYDAQKYFEQDAATIRAYIQQEGLVDSAKLDTASGIWYVLYDAGDSASYNYSGSNGQINIPIVKAAYAGQLLNGTEFDSSEGAEFNLINVIQAWQIAFVPRAAAARIGMPGLTEQGLKKGAKIRLITPSPYAYQSQARGLIPPNSPLDFMIEVLDIRSASQSN